MARRARHPSFGQSEAQALLEAMERARRGAIMCGASVGFGKPRELLCRSLVQAIDALAADLTGDPTYFHLKSAVSGSVKFKPD
jgi:hypothetical protein